MGLPSTEQWKDWGILGSVFQPQQCDSGNSELLTPSVWEMNIAAPNLALEACVSSRGTKCRAFHKDGLNFQAV